MQFPAGQFEAKKVGDIAPKRMDLPRANLVDEYHRFIHLCLYYLLNAC